MAMMKWLTDCFKLEKKPKKGLMAFEWVVMVYLLATLCFVLVMHDRLPHADGMVWGRMKVLAITIAMWAVYRMLPCRFTRMTRAAAQMALLSWWYPDLFELNRTFPNLDHLFALRKGFDGLGKIGVGRTVLRDDAPINRQYRVGIDVEQLLHGEADRCCQLDNAEVTAFP